MRQEQLESVKWSRAPPAPYQPNVGRPGPGAQGHHPAGSGMVERFDRLEGHGEATMSSATYGNETDTKAPLWEIPSFEESNKAFELIDEGVYILTLASVDEPVKVLPKYDPSGKKYRARFVFEVVSDVTGDTAWAGTKVSMYYTLTMNEKSNLYPVAKALMGGQVDPGQRITPTMLIGKRMQAMIAHGEPNDNGDVWPIIKSPIAIRRKTTIEDIAETMDGVPF